MNARVTFPVLLAALCCTALLGAEEAGSTDAPFLIPEEVRRFALVIGVENYQEFPKATNALNDAKEVAQMASRLRFSTVHHLKNPSWAQINDFVNALGSSVGSEPAVILFFFAGHGFQYQGLNYIVPENARARELVSSSYPLMNVFGTIVGNRPGLAIVLLDACRTSLTSTSTSPPVGRTLDQGFSAVGTIDNAVLGFASQFGSPALGIASSSSANSPYTVGLMSHIGTEAISLDQMFDRVRTDVLDMTGDTQSPQVVKGAASSAFAFLPTQVQRDAERTSWEKVLHTAEARCMRRYIKNHPDSPYLAAALRALETRSAGTGGRPCPE